MRALKRVPEAEPALENSFESMLTQFSAATLELRRVCDIPEFGRALTESTLGMLGASAVVLALDTGRKWELTALAGTSRRWSQLAREQLANMLQEQASEAAPTTRTATRNLALSPGLAAAYGCREFLVAGLTGRDGNLLGSLAVTGLAHGVTAAQHQFYDALASHASMALENLRLSSRFEQSRKRWMQDFDAITDFVVVHDASNLVIRINRALASLLGIRLGDAIGWNVCRLPVFNASTSGQCPLCRNTGALEEFVYQAADRTYLVSTSRTDSSEDAEPRSVHVLKDVTERREADRRYKRERDFNKNILNNTQSMILVLDTAGLISYANRRCSEAGYGEERLLGRPLLEMVPAACQHVLSRALEETLEGKAIENLETPLRRGDSVGQFQITLSPMRDEQGEINSIVVVMSDITEAANLQAKLMHTEKMAALGQLVSGVAHEVNNPLAAIIGFTDLLLENPSVPAEARDDLQIILLEAQRTRVIVQNLLSFAREMPSQREPVQVNTVLRQTLKFRAYDFSSNGIDVSENYDASLPLAVGDPNQLQQVFLNIINNAYDAIQDGRKPGKIQVMTSHTADRLEISFWNSGPPISNPDRIFDPFFTTKDAGKGTGLGLSICYGIVHAHGGEIVARNEADGSGCEFVVRLPAATVKSPTSPRSPGTQEELECKQS